MGLTFDADFLIDNNVGECLQFFKHLLSFDENHKVLGEDLMTYKTSFFRDYVCNKETDFYVDYSRFYVKPEELISFAKSIGGKVFLAHPYEYRLKDVDDLLNTVKDLGVDGIECYYPTFTKKQVDHLLNFTKVNNLQISGGSDFHGGKRPNQLSILNEEHQVDYNHLNWTTALDNINEAEELINE
ncbi:MAG: hypothetical protein M0R51_00530 [Clostridia bacterium]|jgi:hypothetical protein|nr:hypothetical protein [Clostridia bacterium]